MATVLELRQAGFNDLEIESHVNSEGQRLSQAGFSQEEINKHFDFQIEPATQSEGLRPSTRNPDEFDFDFTQQDFGQRADGTQKGQGFFGELPITFPDGRSGVATEFSIGVEFDGKETQIPTLVPTLTQEELDLMTNDIIPNSKPIPDAIANKAIEHAKKRITAGKSPFQEEEQFSFSDNSIQPFDPAEAPIQGETFKAGAVERAAIQIARDVGLISLLPLREAGIAGGAAVPSPDELAQTALRKKLPEITGSTALVIGKFAAAHGLFKTIGFLQALPKSASVITKAAETAKLFGGVEAIDQIAKAGFNKITDEDLPYEGAIGVMKSAAFGMLFSLALQGTGKLGRVLWNKLRPTEQSWALKQLGLKKGATIEEINKAARKEALKFHPDKVKGFREDFEQVIKARDILRKTPAEDIIFAKPKPKLLPGEVAAPAEAAITTPKPPAIQLKAEKPTIVPPKAEIAAPTEVVKPEIEPKALPTKEVTAKKAQEGKVGKFFTKLEMLGRHGIADAAQLPRLAKIDPSIKKEDVRVAFKVGETVHEGTKEEALHSQLFLRLVGDESIPKGDRKLLKESIGKPADESGVLSGFTVVQAPAQPPAVTEGKKLKVGDKHVSGQFVNVVAFQPADVEGKPVSEHPKGTETIEVISEVLEQTKFDETGKAVKPGKVIVQVRPMTADQLLDSADKATKAFKKAKEVFGEDSPEAAREKKEAIRLTKASQKLDREQAQPSAADEIAKQSLRDKIARARTEKSKATLQERLDRLEGKPTEKEVVIEKPIEVRTKIPKTPKEPVTESPTIPLKGKEAQVFREEVRTQEKITAAEAGEVGIEPAGKSFTDHIDTFHSYQLPETSKIPRITKQMKKINGLRLAGKITPQQANRRIHKLRQLVIRQAIKEKIALRVSKKGKVKIALRESGVFVPEEVATYKKYKDIEPILGGGQDITRAIQQMDGSLTVKEKLQTKGQAGPIERFVLFRSRKMQIQKLNWLKEKTIELQSILEAKKGSKKDKEINLILEKIGAADRNIPIEKIIDKKTLASFNKESIKAAQELRQFYDELIEEQNTARVMRGQDEIPYRQNYSPNILRDTTVWEQLFLRDKTAKVLEKKDLPDYIKPNAPFNPRAQAREADIPYDKRILSSRELAESYTITASKDIFNTSIIQNNKAFIDQLKGQGLEKTADYLGEWTATSFAGIKPQLDRTIKLPKWPKLGLRYFNRLRNMAVFPFNVAWSLSTQPLSLANTIGRYGLPNTIRGFFQWLQPSIRKQAAEDYFSFIVKTTKRGGVTKQDASNLLGDNIKIQKTVGEFAENFSTILLTEMEKLLTGTSIRAAHIQGKKRGLTGEALKNFASDGGGKTQSMYNDEDKPMILRSLLVKSAAPYQTYAFEVANTFREWAGKTGTPPDSKLYAMWSVTRWLASLIVLRMIANKVRSKEWEWWDLVPIPFRETLFSPIVDAITGKFGQTAYGLPSPIGTGVRVGRGLNDVFETGNWRRLRNEMIKYGAGVLHPWGLGVPGGVQWSRIVDAIITYASGGLTDRRGRVMFEMKDPIDLARAMFTGVWSTTEAQALLKKRQGKQKKKSKPGKFKFGK